MKYYDWALQNGNVMHISKMVLGTDYFGTSVPEETAFRLMDQFVDAGGNCLDTARFYADWIPGGHDASETVIGRWLAAAGKRDRVLLSTKGGHPPLDQMDQGRVTLRDVQADLDKSLRVLGVDYVDVYWLHRDDPAMPASEIMELMSVILKTGKVRAIGCSNWRIKRIKEANDYAETNGLTPFGMSQIQWSLASSTPEAHGDTTKVIMNDEEYEGYVAEQMPVMAYSSQAKGFFARPVSGPNAINQKSFDWFYSEENVRRRERVHEYAKERGLEPNTVALGYILCNPLPGLALVGCRSEEQLASSLSAADVDISYDDLMALTGASK